MCVCIHIKVNHFAVQWKITTLYVNQLYFTKKKLSRDSPRSPVVKAVLPMQGPQVRALVRAIEPICHN